MTSKQKTTLRAVFAIGIIILFVMHYQEIVSSDTTTILVDRFGYGGVALAALLSGIAGFPVPLIAFAPGFVDLGLELPFVIIAIAVGLTLGDLITFFVGRWGRSIDSLSQHRLTRRVETYLVRHPNRPRLIVFLWATFAPLPNEIILLPLGIVGARIAHVALPLFAGNLIFNFLAGYGIF